MNDKNSVVDMKIVADALALAPRVSVVIPTFNRRHLLPDAVDSCLNQSYENIEVIIVDDGSTDDTDDFIDKQLSGPWNGRVRYFRQTNSGASAARNSGLKLATGQYVQFLDSDDVLFTDKIAQQIQQFETAATEQELCTCYGRVGPAAHEFAKSQRIGIQCATPTEYIRQMCGGVIHGMQTSAPLWNRSFLVNRPGWRADISLGDDLEYYLRLLTETRNVGFVAQDLFLVREHDGPHLSDAGGNRDRVASAIRAHQAVVETVRTAGIWDEHVQKGVLRKARSLYANILQCGTEADILMYENWMTKLLKAPANGLPFRLLVLCRRFLGQHFILLAHGFFMRLRAVGRGQ